MASQKSSEAYDFALFEPKRQQEAPQKKSNIIELPKEQLEKNRRTRINPLKAVSGLLALVVMLGVVGTIVYGQVQLTELTEQLNSASKTLDESESVYTQYKMKSDSQFSLQAVESYATDKLGMKKVEQSQVEPIELSSGDKTQVVQKDQEPNWLSSLWNAIVQLLS
jgi:Cell division protein FtsL.